MHPTLTVAIVTHNRVGYLRKALDGLARQTLPHESLEVIVVDNASTDSTRELVEAAAPNVRYIFEGTLGANVARDTAWRAARAPYVAYLDDDAIPSPEWAERIVWAFTRVTPHPSCVGGPVEPIYEAECPPWLTGPLLDYLTVIDFSPTPRFLVDMVGGQKLASANMAVERAALERIGGFRPGLDRVGASLLSGGDTLVQIELEKLGLAIYYDPAIHVRHHVSAGRLTQAFMVKRAYWQGASDALLAFWRHGGSVWWALRTLSWGTRSVLTSPRTAAHLFTQQDVVARCAAWNRLGFVRGGLQALRLAFQRTDQR